MFIIFDRTMSTRLQESEVLCALYIHSIHETRRFPYIFVVENQASTQANMSFRVQTWLMTCLWGGRPVATGLSLEADCRTTGRTEGAGYIIGENGYGHDGPTKMFLFANQHECITSKWIDNCFDVFALLLFIYQSLKMACIYIEDEID